MHAFSTCIVGSLFLASSMLAQSPSGAAKRDDESRRARLTPGIISARIESVANRAELIIATKSELGSTLKLFDAGGEEVAAQRTPDGLLKAEVDSKRGYVLAPALPGRQLLPEGGLEFPARYVTFPPTGTVNLGGLFLRPTIVPLTWDDKARTYATELIVGYEFVDGAERRLPAPKTVRFFAEGANARIEADTVTIAESGVAGYQRVRLSTGQIQGETHFIARASPVDELKCGVQVRREPGALTLSLPSTELPAFGIGSSELTVSLLARDGVPLAVDHPFQLQLSSRRLRQPALLVLERGQSTATADVRTAGFGRDQIVAQSGALRAELPITLVFPTAAVVAALLGGALGGAARYLRNRRRRGPLLTRRIVEGMLVGVIVVGAAWTGLVSVSVSTGVLGTPFGAFVLSALSGYLGCVVLDRVANRTFGGGLKAGA